MSKQILRQQLQSTLTQLDRQITNHNLRAKEQGIDPTLMMTPDGAYTLVPILAAKAHALAALAYLTEDRRA